MKILNGIDESDKFDDPIELYRVLAFIYEKELISLSEFKANFHFNEEQVNSYIRRLRLHYLVGVKIVDGIHYIERKSLVGEILAEEVLRIIDSQMVKNKKFKKKEYSSDDELIIVTPKFTRLWEDLEEILLHLEPKLEEENFL
ncbi:MAG: hypothetical protein ACFFFT_00055 [Candidatus Thorarchaeota archaeon]